MTRSKGWGRKGPRPGGVATPPLARPKAEPATNPARRTPTALAAAILVALAGGPLMKWQLREALHEPEAVVYKALLALRAAGTVKVVGKVLNKRGWALIAWTSSKSPWRNETIVVPKRPEPPATSWWAQPMANRSAFTKAQAQRERQAGWTGVPSTLAKRQ